VPTKTALLEEFSELSNLQTQALQLAVYIKMDTATGEEYDSRARRISEIIKLLDAS